MLEEVTLEQPFWPYFELYRERPYSFLLDSANEDGGGRYSFAGAEPVAVFEARRLRAGPDRHARVSITRLDPERGVCRADMVVADPFRELQRLVAEFALPRDALARPVPFVGGAVGYFGYEAGYFVEKLPDRGCDDLGLPDIAFALFDSVLAADRQTGAAYLSAIGRGHTEAEALKRATRLRDVRLRELEGFSPSAPAVPRGRSPSITGHFDRPGYARAVETCKRHIDRGDVFEICLTHRLEAKFTGEPWELYKALRRISPSPFAAYLNLPGAQVVCSSPERFLRLDADGVVESRPIKGTRPRGVTLADDRALHDELLASPKDRAENMMIVDLVRNDLGRVCEIGSVEVPALMRVERYATLFQLTSLIRGRLEEGRDWVDLVRAAFPGGSMTGAPKIEAMKIIDGLEPVKRGIYSGSIGYLDFTGTADLNIVIRTLTVCEPRVYFNVGGAVVADSDPLDEYDETMDKAYALERALAVAGTG